MTCISLVEVFPAAAGVFFFGKIDVPMILWHVLAFFRNPIRLQLGRTQKCRARCNFRVLREAFSQCCLQFVDPMGTFVARVFFRRFFRTFLGGSFRTPQSYTISLPTSTPGMVEGASPPPHPPAFVGVLRPPKPPQWQLRRVKSVKLAALRRPISPPGGWGSGKHILATKLSNPPNPVRQGLAMPSQGPRG